MTNQNYSAAEIEFLQCLLDRYSETGNLVRADDNPAFMAIVRKHYGEPLSDRTDINPATVHEVVEAAEHLCDFGTECTQEKWDALRTSLAKLREGQE